jgi:hypothetical protein
MSQSAHSFCLLQRDGYRLTTQVMWKQTDREPQGMKSGDTGGQHQRYQYLETDALSLYLGHVETDSHRE